MKRFLMAMAVIGLCGCGDSDDAGLPAPGGALVMYYTGKDGDTKRIGRATSTDHGLNWTRDALNPVLDLGAAGAWDELAVTDSCIIKIGGIFHLYYAGESAGGSEQIGVATSTDGRVFTRHPANPILTLGAPGAFDESEVSNPAVLLVGSTYYMWYAGVAADDIQTTGLATSPDGIAWTKFGSGPVINVGPPGSSDEVEVSDPTIIRLALGGMPDALFVNYTTDVDQDFSFDLEGNRSIGMAVSADGKAWNKMRAALLTHGNPGDFDSLRVGNAEIELIKGKFHLYYGGRSDLEDLGGADIGAIGYATSTDGLKFTKVGPVITPIPGSWEGTLTANPTILAIP